MGKINLEWKNNQNGDSDYLCEGGDKNWEEA